MATAPLKIPTKVTPIPSTFSIKSSFTMPSQPLEYVGNEMGICWKWGENVVRMRWEWDENMMRMRWKCGENEMRMRWECGENEMRMWWEWDGNEVRISHHFQCHMYIIHPINPTSSSSHHHHPNLVLNNWVPLFPLTINPSCGWSMRKTKAYRLKISIILSSNLRTQDRQEDRYLIMVEVMGWSGEWETM